MNIKEILMEDDIVKSINNNLEELLLLIPEIKYMIGFEHKHPHHHLDVWEHTLLSLSNSPKDFEIRLCLLLHDIGKPFSYVDGPIRHFPNHPIVSAQIASRVLHRLGADNNFIDEVCYLIIMHDTAITKEEINSNYTLAYKRYKIQICDALAHHPLKLEKKIKYLEKTKKLLTDI